jgi:hypothetical protein
MSATKEVFDQVVDHALASLQSENVNNRSWESLKVTKPFLRANIIGVAVCMARDAVKERSDPVEYWKRADGIRRKGAFIKSDHFRAIAQIQRLLKQEAFEDAQKRGTVAKART